MKSVYGGPKGALLTVASTLSLHIPMGERLFRKRKFDLRGVRSALDVGSGAGQLAKHLLKYGDPGIKVACTDLSQPMLRRARTRLKSEVPEFVAADLACLPFADGSFDCVTCGYVLEHLPDPEPGLSEMARVLQPGGRMLLLVTEDSFSGACDEPAMALSYAQSQRTATGLRKPRLNFEARDLVHADAQNDAGGRDLHRDCEAGVSFRKLI